MTLSPTGSHLAPHDLPPPPPSQDPREPPSSTPRRAGTATPQRPHSPVPSRGASPQRSTSTSNGNVSHMLGGAIDRSSSHDLAPLHAPTPRHASASPSMGTGTAATAAHPHPIPHHLSRPSSPSSIHSSTSAIFERDIEHPSTTSSLSLNPAASPVNPALAHKPSRLGFVHGSALDHSVPAVLDDAVEALTATSRGIEGLEIEAPAPMTGGGGGGVGMMRVASGTSGRHVSSPPLSGLTVGQSQLRSGSSSPISTTSAPSSITSPTQSPPILAQLGAGSGMATGADRASMGSSATSVFSDKSTVEGMTTEPLKDKSDDATMRPVRPAAPTRMSTGRQVPGGWLSAWTKEEADARAEGVEMGEGHPHPGQGEVGVGLERTAGILGEQERVISLDELPTPPSTTTPLTHPSSPPPASAIPHHLNPSSSASVPTAHNLHNQDAKRRISFISPTDLLLSVPTSVTSLGEIASGNLSPEHVHMAGSSSPAMGRSPRLSSSGEGEKSGMWQDASGVAGAGGAEGGNTKGEWGREGLGRGLEQRLEELEKAGH